MLEVVTCAVSKVIYFLLLLPVLLEPLFGFFLAQWTPVGLACPYPPFNPNIADLLVTSLVVKGDEPEI